MGPNLDGISTQSDWSTQWPDDQLPIAWSQEIGIGFSSVSIVDDRLYTMGNVDTAESVYCFDATTGEPVWKHSYACELVAVLYEGGPGSTPTVDGDSVYAVGKEGQLMCLAAADGKLRWQKNLQDDLGVPLHEWGFNASPLILDDQVIVAVGRLVSYDKATGEKRWQSEPHTAGYGCVRAFPHDGRRLLATLDSDGLRISDASDGTEVAFTDWKSPFRTNATTPIIHDDTFFISTGYQIGCGLFRLADDELQEIYVNREMRNHFNNSILHKGLLYGFDGNSNLGRVVHLKCMDHKTGEVLWKHRGLGCGSLMIADDKLIVLSDDGRLLVAPASSDGFEPLAEAQILEGRCWTVPVLHNRRVYARNAAGKLVCVQLPSR
ncbi:MAG: PQQ-like beta-propeller repeat protein [Pirellulaceae bacterium]|nr:PQQ-like beta-propeller repeat protein [Pirellulaceae bacterium]